MSEQRILKDTAHAAAKDIVGVFANLLRDEELKDAYEKILPRVSNALERFARLVERERRRIHGTDHHEWQLMVERAMLVGHVVADDLLPKCLHALCNTGLLLQPFLTCMPG